MNNIKLKQLGAILLMVGVVLIGLTLNTKRSEGTLWMSPTTVQGRIIDRYTTPSRNAIKPELWLRVEFAPAGSKRVIARAVQDTFWEEHPKGSKVEVAWHGSKFDDAKLVGASNEMLLFWLKIGGGAAAFLLGWVVLGYDRWHT